MPPRTVFLDATPLSRASGLRGIGRYLRDLLAGLALEREATALRVRAIVRARPGSISVTDDLLEAAALVPDRVPPVGKMSPGIARTIAAHAALNGAQLLHMTEVHHPTLLRPIPIVATCYDLIPLHYPRWYIATRAGEPAPPLYYAVGLARRWIDDVTAYHLARRVVAISEATRRDLIGILRLPPSRVDVAPTGLDLSRYTNRAWQPDDDRFALYVGYGDWRKNVHVMFRSVRAARRARPELRLKWAGHIDPPILDRMRRIAAEEGVVDAVDFLGFVTDEQLSRLYSRATALLFPSRLEGFGLPVLEAMACGCPPIVARGSGCDEIVGVHGLVCDADDVLGIAAHLVRLDSNILAARERSEEGVRRAAEFSHRRMARAYLAVYEKALA